MKVLPSLFIVLMFTLLPFPVVGEEMDKPDPEDTSKVEADEASLLTEEFTYTALFDRKYGVLMGVGKSSPRHLAFVGFSFSLPTLKRLHLSLALGCCAKWDRKKEEGENIASETQAVSIRAQYFFVWLPFNVGFGSGLARWEGNVDQDSYRGNEIYLDTSLGIYYFWRGIYVESVIYGVSVGKAFALDPTTTSATVTAEIEELESYGVFGNGSSLNLTVGYFF